MLTGKEAVIFDLDGTLVDSMWVWTQIDIEYLGRFGLSVPDNLQNILEGMSFTETAVYFKEHFALPQSVEEIKQTWQEMAMEAYKSRVPLKPGVREFLPWLKEQGLVLGVASSNAIELIEAVLNSHGIRHYFDSIITACQVKKGKPAPDVYLKAADELGVRPGSCLVFEDILPGIQAGQNAGMTVCAVEDKYSHAQKQEKKESAGYFITSYTQVIDGTYEEA